MSTKKSKTNGAVHAPESPILTSDATVSKSRAKNGTADKSNGTKNGKSKVPTPYTPTELDGMIDSKQLLKVLAEMRNGNFAVRMPNDGLGLSGKIYDTLNDIIILNEILVQELTEARKIIGKQGKLNHRVELPRLARGS